ncbi:MULTISPECIES: capsid assembly scaffolding protein Gp46 family protein [Aerococcus]|uniref:DUF4355 domain-containing protein n=1 Tax=Aerococcus tenax TaxID=3078812 RepID=A0A329N7A1_9LACT|nr:MULTISPECIES: DUF4355 domain-containing protein [Aerococcus]MDL5184713.1 DUF4355 domain-containing protein [Aerococcus mictus]KAA9238582.1 hypothetical protein F6I34_08025 [Aerococcus urinae]MDK6371989.1 DUF4355 domain-containing protein [Aerococcus urinae]MDK7302429.1 DUF4355 domain-containing protein [Aerococcus urinae]MDK7802288.1 DUF4355 domain-containing protein [Aerococcus urinae]
MNRKFLEDLGLEKTAVDSIMAEYGKSINTYKDQEAELEALKEQNKVLEQASQDASNKYTQLESSLQEKQASIDDLTKQLDGANLQNLRVQAALDNGLPYTFADRLKGSDEESLKADAKSFAELYNNKPNPEPPMKSTEPNNGSVNPYAQMADNLINSIAD